MYIIELKYDEQWNTLKNKLDNDIKFASVDDCIAIISIFINSVANVPIDIKDYRIYSNDSGCIFLTKHGDFINIRN